MSSAQHMLTDDETSQSGSEPSDIHHAAPDFVPALRSPCPARFARAKLAARNRGNTVTGREEPSHYSPLPADMIRMLHIRPAIDPGEPLVMTLNHAAAEPDTYIALSYAWGSPNRTHRVTCNGRPFRVTASLHDALLRIRRNLDRGMWHDDKERPGVWADAICIDQDDVEDKNRQVQNMHQIYQRARAVVHFLRMSGSINPESRPVLGTLKTHLDFAHRGYLDALQMTEQDQAEVCGYLFRGSSWLTRRWIVQEYALNKRRTIIIGDLITDGADLSLLLAYNKFISDQYSGVVRWSATFDSDTPRRWLLTNIFLFRKTYCSNELDKVYALTAISCGCATARACSHHGGVDCSSGVVVDYNRAFNDVLWELSQQWVRQDPIALLLVASTETTADGVQSKSSPDRPIPSWTPAATDPIFTKGPQPMTVLWKEVEDLQCFEVRIPDEMENYGFIMAHDRIHWRQDADHIRERSSTEVERLDASSASNGGSHLLEKPWADMSHMPAVVKENDPKILLVTGLMLQTPSPPCINPRDLDWSRYEINTNPSTLLRWNDQADCNCTLSEDAFEIWQPGTIFPLPKLLPNQVVLLILGYRVALILQKTDVAGRYVFIRCMMRYEPIRSLRFVWMQREIVTGKTWRHYVWAFGSLEGAPVQVEII